MNTRQDYLDKKCTHAEYYAQFVDETVIGLVKRKIGEEAIRRSKDKHFNDIPLGNWDNLYCTGLPHSICSKLRAVGDIPTLSSAVSIAKEAARQIKEGK